MFAGPRLGTFVGVLGGDVSLTMGVYRVGLGPSILVSAVWDSLVKPLKVSIFRQHSRVSDGCDSLS